VHGMLIRSDRFGDLDVADDKLLTFADGLLGFPEAQRFALVDTQDSGVYFWLQSVDDPSLAFLSVDPWAFFPEYSVDLPDAEERSLGIGAEEDVLVLCLLTVRRDASATAITANLLGPLVINTTSGLGRQVVLAESGYPVRAPLAA
jgi:flagellar assembly factor FliW